MNFATFVPAGELRHGILWLSGLTCTEENFMAKAGAQRILAEQRTMVLVPDTSPRGLHLRGEHESYDFGSGAGFYLDATVKDYSQHYRMYSYILKEIYPLFRDHFGIHTVSIMGHSMGGHGALVFGLRNPHLFQKITTFAPIVNPSQVPWGTKALSGYLGDPSTWHAYDACELLKSGHRHPEPIVIYQGTKDEYLDSQLKVDRFAHAADTYGQKYELRLCEGYDHSYYFIQTFFGEALAFT